MRPRKKVLLYCADEAIGGNLAYVLDVGCVNPGLAITSAFSPMDFLDESLSQGAQFDCVVVVRTSPFDLPILSLLKGQDVGKLTVEVMNGLPPINESCAEKRIFGPIKDNIPQIIETVRMACTRKRGPKGPALEIYSFNLATIGKAA